MTDTFLERAGGREKNLTEETGFKYKDTLE